jgi:hypothetical protein
VIPIEPSATAAAPQAMQDSGLEVALTSPAQIQASARSTVEFPIVIDATAALPERSILTITALPDGASFSQGQPHGDNGWSLRPDEIAGLQLKLPAENAAGAMHLQLVAGDGTVLARSDTALNAAALPPTVATVDDPGVSPADFAVSAPVMQTAALETAPAEAIPRSAAEELARAESPLAEATAPAETTEEIVQAEATASVADAPPPPQQKPSVNADSQPKVNTVKTVAVAPPREAKPYDGAMALGAPADEPQGTGEWMVTKTAVDMHAKAEQSSETVKVAQGGVKMRVVARDNRWIQVHDPASSTTGWIYDRFLTPAETPAQ